MIIWINGAFGIGKTQVAYELLDRIEDGVVFDPESVGEYLRRHIPHEFCNINFQDDVLWREITFQILDVIDNGSKLILVPMTVIHEQYYEEIIGRLRLKNHTVIHITLVADYNTILLRLKKRFSSSNSWAAHQLETCLKCLSGDKFENKIDTNNLEIYEVAEKIAEISMIKLIKPRKTIPQQRKRVLGIILKEKLQTLIQTRLDNIH